MSEKTAQVMEIPPAAGSVEESRVLPLAIAAFLCFVISVTLGSGAWYLFGSRDSNQFAQLDATTSEAPKSEGSVSEIQPNPALSDAPSVQTAAEPNGTNQSANQPAANEPKIEGVVEVEGGEVAIGGDEKRPLQRLIINDFAVAETEVTNARYSEFIRESGHAAPPGWNKSKFPGGTENYPVTNVSWRDADAFCRWLAKKLDAEVRLPTEAEWELAAAGRGGKKYPWGDNWNKEGGHSLESGGKVAAVKSFAINRSTSGAFDMVGNVWEWTQDKVTDRSGATDETVAQALKGGRTLRVVKGGSAEEKAAQISAQARYEIPETAKAPTVGFRYVVVRNP